MWRARNGISRSLFVCLLPAYQSALASLQSQLDCRGQLKCAGTRAETRFRLSVKRTSPFKSAGASVQSTTGSRGVRIGGSNAGYTMLQGSVKGSGYPFHSPVSPLLPSLASPCAITFQLESTRFVELQLHVFLTLGPGCFTPRRKDPRYHFDRSPQRRCRRGEEEKIYARN